LRRWSLILFFCAREIRSMMGERRVMQEALFYGFSLERHVPDDHMLRKIDRFVDLSEVRAHLSPYYSDVGRPSIDPELMMRMLIVGYCLGIRSERRLCEEVHLNLACRWSVAWGSTATSLTIRRSPRTATAASARAICCAGYSRRWWRAA
jgi:transposase